MAYRGGPCLSDPAHNGTCGKPGVPNSPHVAFATAPRWDAEFTRLGSQPAWMERTEDPGGLCGSSFDGAAAALMVLQAALAFIFSSLSPSLHESRSFAEAGSGQTKG
eukprot:COSAG06_NODE_3061_length_5906_cov_26.812468_9_plen_107_part_00